jgi:hypothetical protein
MDNKDFRSAFDGLGMFGKCGREGVGPRLVQVRGEGPRPGNEAVSSFRRFNEASNMTADSEELGGCWRGTRRYFEILTTKLTGRARYRG